MRLFSVSGRHREKTDPKALSPNQKNFMSKTVKSRFGEAWVEAARNGFNQMGHDGKREGKSAEVCRKRLFCGPAPNDENSIPGSQTPVGTVLEKGQSQICFPSKK